MIKLSLIKPTQTKIRWFRWLLEIILILGLVLLVRAWQQKELVSGDAPNFQSIMLDGKTINLEDYRGKPFVLHFWADWCPFCKIEENSLSQIKKDWPFLSIAYQSGDNKQVSNYMTERNIQDWPTIVDQDNRIADLFGVNGVPTTYIIDGKGNIRFTEIGLTSGWGIRARLWWTDKFKTD